MKVKVTALLFVLICTAGFAQIQFDTLNTLTVAPGVEHITVHAPEVPWTIDVLTIDLTVPTTTIETVKADDLLLGYERTSSMASRNDHPNHRVAGAINGDFYGGGGIPVNIQVRDGEILRKPIGRSNFGFDVNMNPMTNLVSYSGKVISGSGQRTINGINETRNNNWLVFYNMYMGASTGTNQYGNEALLDPIDEWFVNDTVRCVVSDKELSTGNMLIPDGKSVISGHGTSADFVNSLSVGDTVKIVHSITPSGSKIKEMLGGFPKIVKDGQNYVSTGYYEEGGASTFHTDRHPRTAIGFSADSSKIFFVTVDGRQSFSAGIDLYELADFMIAIGVDYAVNLDGGGSTTMVVRGDIVNSPSDGAERSVSNSFIVVSGLPDGSLNSIQISNDNIEVFSGENAYYETSGWDENYNPVSINPTMINYSLSHDFGTIDNNGYFTAGFEPDTGYVIAEYNGLLDSGRVIINGAVDIEIMPYDLVVDSNSTMQFSITAYDINNQPHQIENDQYTWTSTNPAAADVDSLGNLTAYQSGTTSIIASFGPLSDTCAVSVETGYGSQLVDNMEDLGKWQLNGENIDLTNSTISIDNSTFSEGSGSLRLDYQFVFDSYQIAYAILETEQRLFGTPDTLEIDIESDGEDHHISFITGDDNDEEWRIPMAQYANQTGSFETIYTGVDRKTPAAPEYIFFYPLTLKQIKIRLGSGRVQGQTYTGTLYFDNLRISYPGAISGVDDGQPDIPVSYSLQQNYPNPFNPSTKISFTLPEAGKTTLTIYNSLGEEVAQLINNFRSAGKHTVTWNAENLPSGVYLYQIRAGVFSAAKKMLLLK